MDEMRSKIDWIIGGKTPSNHAPQTQQTIQPTMEQPAQQQTQPQTQPALLPQIQQAQPSAQHTISQAPSAALQQQKPAQPILIQTTVSQPPAQHVPQDGQNCAAFPQFSQPAQVPIPVPVPIQVQHPAQAPIPNPAPQAQQPQPAQPAKQDSTPIPVPPQLQPPMQHAHEPNQRSNGVNINLLSQQMLDGMAGEEKIKFVLSEVMLGKILVLEYGLTPEEQAKLIERTMMEIDPETFIGIEIQSYAAETKMGFFQKLVGKTARPRMTVIGPADLLRIVHKDNRVIQTMVLTGKGIGWA